MATRIELSVTGKTHTVKVEPDMPLLYALGDDPQMVPFDGGEATCRPLAAALANAI